MLHLLEILVIVAAFATLVATGVKTGRKAMSLNNHVQQVSREAQVKVFSIVGGANSAQAKAQALPDRLMLLQRRQVEALVAVRRLTVIVSAFQEARQPLNRVLEYIGR